MKAYCNKCNERIRDMNDCEIEEYLTEGSFVCSECIQEEMKGGKIKACQPEVKKEKEITVWDGENIVPISESHLKKLA